MAFDWRRALNTNLAQQFPVRPITTTVQNLSNRDLPGLTVTSVNVDGQQMAQSPLGLVPVQVVQEFNKYSGNQWVSAGAATPVRQGLGRQFPLLNGPGGLVSYLYPVGAEIVFKPYFTNGDYTFVGVQLAAVRSNGGQIPPNAFQGAGQMRFGWVPPTEFSIIRNPAKTPTSVTLTNPCVALNQAIAARQPQAVINALRAQCNQHSAVINNARNYFPVRKFF